MSERYTCTIKGHLGDIIVIDGDGGNEWSGGGEAMFVAFSTGDVFRIVYSGDWKIEQVKFGAGLEVRRLAAEQIRETRDQEAYSDEVTISGPYDPSAIDVWSAWPPTRGDVAFRIAGFFEDPDVVYDKKTISDAELRRLYEVLFHLPIPAFDGEADAAPVVPTLPENPTREQVYDLLIAPLMSQIIEITKAHKIPLFATFELDTPKDEPTLYASTSSVDEHSSAEMREHLAVLNRQRRGFAAAFTISRDPKSKPS